MRDHTVDFLIVGSGAGCVPAALQAIALGKTALIIEKLPVIGGSTAYSGGVGWFPNTHHLRSAGGSDSPQKARQYLDAVVPLGAPSSSPAKRDAFCEESAGLVEFLEKRGMKFEHAGWPDYYSDFAGGTPEGRSLVAPVFVIEELGEWANRFSGHPVYRHFPIGAYESCLHLGLAKRTWTGRFRALRVAARMLRQKLTGKRLGMSGQSFQGRLLKVGLEAGVPFWPDTPCTALLSEEGRVLGVQALHEGEPVRIRARNGVLVNAGGFARNQALRDQYLPQPSPVAYTQSPPGDQGDLLMQAQALGAAIDNMDAVIYVAGSFAPDGSLYGMHQPAETGKPHSIVVDQRGRRFTNEASSYMEFGRDMYKAGAVPAWAILESRHRRRYNWGIQLPGAPPESWFTSGYARRANSLEELARLCGMDAAVLNGTVARFNQFAQRGVDEDFGRGASAYDRAWGDPTNGTPNPSLGALERPPFYAVPLHPVDVGTAGGLVTDEHARVLRPDGAPIPGLYATGNSTASLFGPYYPGAGASISASMVFGFRAARHACLTASAGSGSANSRGTSPASRAAS